MISPADFDKKLNELRMIERRMMNYDHKTPISTVVSDQRLAHDIYKQLSATISKIKE